MARPDFTTSLSEATDGLGEVMPAEVTRRLRNRLAHGRAPRRVRWDRVAGAGVLLLAIGLVVSLRAVHPDPTSLASAHPERSRGSSSRTE